MNYSNKFINPNVDRIEDTTDNLFKKNNKYKISNISGTDLKQDKIINIDDERTIREKITVINIDSSNRNQIPKNIFNSSLFTLNNSPLTFIPKTNIITIYQNNHKYILNDKIALNNVVGKNTKMKHALYLKQNSQYIKIKDPTHNMTFEYNNRKLFLNLSNIIGNNVSKTTLGQIPINFINRRHEILFIPLNIDNDDAINLDQDIIDLQSDINYINNLNIQLLNDLQSLQLLLTSTLNNEINPLTGSIKNLQQIVNKLIPKFYLLKIPIVSKEDYVPNTNTGTNLENSCIKITFLHLFGIPISLINADYPLNNDRKVGSHLISKIIDKNTFQIQVNAVALVPRNTLDPNLLSGGGSCLEIAKIGNTINGYPNPNNYIVPLGRTFYNIKRVEIIGSIFPVSEQIFKLNINNKLYWNNLEDGSILYNIGIDPGTYDVESLTIELNEKFKTIFRQTIEDQIQLANGTDFNSVPLIGFSPLANPDFINYEKYHIINTQINIDKNIINFDSFKKIYVSNAIQKDNSVTLRIFHPFHVFDNEDINVTYITINEAKDTEDIPASAINGKHIITGIYYPHIYTVQLPNYEPLAVPNPNSFGGNFIEIMYPDKFRMLFLMTDTMGKELGFNYVSEPYAITPFQYSISNITQYDIDDPLLFNNSTNTVIQLQGEPYILIVNDILANYENNSNILNVFAKIHLKLLEQQVDTLIAYNTFEDTPKIFENPLTSLTELEFFFYSANGQLYNFNGQNHSFSLRITEIISLPRDSHINSRTGNAMDTFAVKDIKL